MHAHQGNLAGSRATTDNLRREPAELKGLFEQLRVLPPGRVYAGRISNWGGACRVGSVPMHDLLLREGFATIGNNNHALSLNADVAVTFDERSVDQHRLFNVRYVVKPLEADKPAFYKLIGSHGRHQLYEISGSGYFDLVWSNLAFAGDKYAWYPAAARWLISPLMGAKQHPVIIFLNHRQRPHSHLRKRRP